MQKNTVFISYKFNDERAAQYVTTVRDVVSKLRRTHAVDAHSLLPVEGFSGHISTFIRESVSCLVAIFTKGAHSNVNAVFETGVAIGAGKPVVLVADSLDIVPTMLTSYDIQVCDADRLTWLDDFRLKLEQKLRMILQLPDDHLIEDKLQRRYTPEELHYFLDADSVAAIIEFIRVGDLPKAQGALEIRLDAQPDSKDLLFLLGDVLYLRGCASDNPAERKDFFSQQLSVADRALGSSPDHVLLLIIQTTALMRLGQFALAKQALLHQLSIDNKFSVGHYNMACCAAILGERTVALFHLKEATILNPIWKSFARGDPDFKDYSNDNEWKAITYSPS